MVSLRDGKSYGSASSAGTTAPAAKSRRASTAVAEKASKPAASRRTARSAPAAAVTAPAQQDDAVAPEPIKPPQAPAPGSTPAKRGRAHRETKPELPATSTKGLDVAAASLAPLPDDAEEGPSGPPSPVPQKKKLKVQPSSSKQAGAGSAPAPKTSKRRVWLLLLAALGAAAAGGIVVACDRPHPVELQPVCNHVQPAWHRLTQQQLPGAQARWEAATAQVRQQGRAVYWQLVHHATDLKARAQEHAQALQGQLAPQLQGLLRLLDRQPAQQQQQQPRRTLDTTPLPRLLPDTRGWQEVALDIREALAAPRRPKAVALLLACGSEQECAAAGHALSVVQPAPGCAMSTSGHAPDESAGALQAQLAAFLSGCPQGVVVLTHAEQLSRGWWPVLVNALSEQGGFQHNGHVDASQALFVLLLRLPPEEVAGAADHHSVDGVSSILKQKWIDDLQQGAGGGEEVLEVLEPLRRRIDFAAPARPQPPQADVAAAA